MKSVGHAGVVERRHRVAAAGDRNKLAGLGSLRRMFARPRPCRWSKGCISKAPSGPFQTSVAASSIAPLDALDRLRADVEDHAVGRNRVDAIGVRRRIGLELERDDGVDRQDDRALRGLGLVQDAARGVGEVASRPATCRRRCPAHAGRCWPCRRRSPAHRPCRRGFPAGRAWSRPWRRRRWRSPAASARSSAFASASSSACMVRPA